MSLVIERYCRPNATIIPTANTDDLAIRDVTDQVSPLEGEGAPKRYVGDEGTPAVMSFTTPDDEAVAMSHFAYKFAVDRNLKLIRGTAVALNPMRIHEMTFEKGSPVFMLSDQIMSTANFDSERHAHEHLRQSGFTFGFDLLKNTLRGYQDGRPHATWWLSTADATETQVAYEPGQRCCLWFGLNLSRHSAARPVVTPVLVPHATVTSTGYLYGAPTGRTLAIGIFSIQVDHLGVVEKREYVPFGKVVQRIEAERESREFAKTLELLTSRADGRPS